MSCPLNTTWELFSSKRLSNSQALKKKNLFQFPTLWLNLFGWGGIKTHMVIFYHSSVVRSNTASFVQHCPCCKGGKRKSVCVFLLEMIKPSLDLLYKITKTIGVGKEEKGKLPQYLLGYMDRLQSYWAEKGILHRAQDIPSWTFPKGHSEVWPTAPLPTQPELERARSGSWSPASCDQWTAARVVHWDGQWLLPS